MKKRRSKYYFNGNGLRLSRADIICRDYSFKGDDTKMIIDLEKLFNMTDEELLKIRGIGQKVLKEVNSVREALKKLLFETDKK